MRNHGHFTTMQVRDGAVRGLDLHLARLREATAELFDVAFDDARATGGLRQALDIAGRGDCTARVTACAREVGRDRTWVESGKSVSVRVGLVGRRTIKK